MTKKYGKKVTGFLPDEPLHHGLHLLPIHDHCRYVRHHERVHPSRGPSQVCVGVGHRRGQGPGEDAAQVEGAHADGAVDNLEGKAEEDLDCNGEKMTKLEILTRIFISFEVPHWLKPLGINLPSMLEAIWM